MKVHSAAFALGLSVAAAASAFVVEEPAASPAMNLEQGWDRPGGDYRYFETDADEPESCERACSGDPQCAAFTYVRAGVQGPRGMCWLKNVAPPPVQNSCCVSGVRHRDLTLAGHWTQASASCGDHRLEELEFTEDGRFSVTFIPFETRQDYWGRYVFDPATGALEMTVEGNNSSDLAGVDLIGSAVFLPNGVLTFEGISFGKSPRAAPAQPCPRSFRRAHYGEYRIRR